MSRARRRGGPSLLAAALLGSAVGLVAGAIARPDWVAELAARIPALGLPGQALELRSVEFLGARRLTPEALLERAGLEAPLALWDVDPEGVCEAIATHPGVAGCTALRFPPDRLIVSLVERTPIAALTTPADGDAVLAVDANGARFPLPADEARDLPRVSGEPELALALLQDAAKQGFAIRAIEVRGPDDLVVLPAQGGVRLRIGLDSARALRGWRKLVSSGLLRTERAREVDLRFRGNAVLRDWNDKDQEGG